MKNCWLCLPLAACMLQAAVAQQASSDAASAAQTAPALRLHLDELIHLALERSPEVKGAEAAIHAMEHRVAPARALPDPALSVGWAGKLAPFFTMAGDASSYRGITVSEQFPYPGKRRLQAEVAERDVDLARADCQASRRRVVLDTTRVFAEYFYLDKAIEATRQNQQLLKKLAGIAEAEYRVGKTMQQDVLRAQVEITMLAEKMAQLEEQRDEAQTSLNEALQQAPDTPLPPPEPIEPRPIRYSLEELESMAGANDSGIQRDQAAVARAKAGVALTERQQRPDIGVGYMFEQRTDQPAMNGVSVTVNLPLFRKQKQQEAVAEAQENVHGADRMQQGRRNAIRAEVRRQYLAAQTAARLTELSSKVVVPQSSLALESAMSGYQVGKVEFLSVIGSFSSVLNYETDSYRQIADYSIAVARLESMTGQPITQESKPETAPPAAAGERGAR